MINISVISPERVLYKGTADYVRLPGTDGSFGILPGHATMVSLLDIGILDIEELSKETNIVVDGGFVEVKADSVNVMVTSGSLKSDLKKDLLQTQLNELEKSDIKNKDLEIKKTIIRMKLLEKS